MDGRNCTGQRISLLNDSGDGALVHSKSYPPPLSAHSHAWSSCASTPSLSPQTPQLSRVNSSDSRHFATPSPLTPSFNSFEGGQDAPPQQSQKQYYYIHSHSFAKMEHQNAAMYPPIPGVTRAMSSAYPLPPQMAPQKMQAQPQQQVFRSSNSMQSEPSGVSAISTASNAKATSKKKHYPCPMAKQISCTDFFTTSGHAARHAKKHTSKKGVFCPECYKAFTRKDNMEQHRRTHQNGRGASRSTTNNADESKVKKPSRTPKKGSVKIEPQQLVAVVEQQLEHQFVEQWLAEQSQPVKTPLAAQLAAAVQAQPLSQQVLEQVLMMSLNAGGPCFLNATDLGPIPAMPNAVPNMHMRPPLHRANFTTSLDYMPPVGTMGTDLTDAPYYSYPSPGLWNGLDSLALAAREHHRLSGEKSQSQSPSSQESPSDETPSEQT